MRTPDFTSTIDEYPSQHFVALWPCSEYMDTFGYMVYATYDHWMNPILDLYDDLNGGNALMTINFHSFLISSDTRVLDSSWRLPDTKTNIEGCIDYLSSFSRKTYLCMSSCSHCAGHAFSLHFVESMSSFSPVAHKWGLSSEKNSETRDRNSYRSIRKMPKCHPKSALLVLGWSKNSKMHSVPCNLHMLGSRKKRVSHGLTSKRFEANLDETSPTFSTVGWTLPTSISSEKNLSNSELNEFFFTPQIHKRPFWRLLCKVEAQVGSIILLKR